MKQLMNVFRVSFAVVFLSSGLTLFVGCNNPNQINKVNLFNTKWQAEDPSYEIFSETSAYRVYEFISDTKVKHYTIKNSDIVDDMGEFKYTLKYTTLIIHDSIIDLEFEFKDYRTFMKKGSNGSGAYEKYIRQ